MVVQSLRLYVETKVTTDDRFIVTELIFKWQNMCGYFLIYYTASGLQFYMKQCSTFLYISTGIEIIARIRLE